MVKFLLVSLILGFSSWTGVSDNTYHSVFEGKKVKDTPFGKYITTDLPGNTLILFISYGCSHCEEFTKEAGKLAKSVDRIIILGYGTSEEKAEFRKNINVDYPMSDYDFSTIHTELIKEDKQFPPPPVAVWVKDNFFRQVYTKIPSREKVEKEIEESN